MMTKEMRTYILLFAACAAASFLFVGLANHVQGPPPPAGEAESTVVFEQFIIEIKTPKED